MAEVKPSLSQLFQDGGWISARGKYIPHPEELLHLRRGSHPDGEFRYWEGNPDWRMEKAEAQLKKQGYFRSPNRRGYSYFAFEPQKLSEFLNFNPEQGFILKPFQVGTSNPSPAYKYSSGGSLKDFISALTLYADGDEQAVLAEMRKLMLGRRTPAEEPKTPSVA